MNKRYLVAVRLAVIGLVLIAIALAASAVIPKLLQPPSNLHLGDGIFQTELALNQTERLKGLSGRDGLDGDKAMLFAFPSEGKWKMQISDMKFPIDIVWLDKFKRVIYIVKDASPDTAVTEIFSPKSEALYVVEFAGGTVDSKSIHNGQLAVFDLDGKQVE